MNRIIEQGRYTPEFQQLIDKLNPVIKQVALEIIDWTQQQKISGEQVDLALLCMVNIFATGVLMEAEVGGMMDETRDSES